MVIRDFSPSQSSPVLNQIRVKAKDRVQIIGYPPEQPGYARVQLMAKPDTVGLLPVEILKADGIILA